MLFGLVLAYSGSALYAWRRIRDRRVEGRARIDRSLHLKLTGSMLAVMVLDGAGYLIAVTVRGGAGGVAQAALEDIFVAVAILTISVGLVLPGMIAHSATELADAARLLSEATLPELTRAMEALGRGDLDSAEVVPGVSAVAITSRDEVGAMASAFNQVQQEVVRAARSLENARNALRRSRGDIEYLATHDALTRLPNRGFVQHHIDQIVDESIALGRECAVVILDLDGFKYVNDSRGHAVGDRVLRRVAELLRSALRPTDFVGRIGSDVFAAALPNIGPEDAQLVIFRLLEAIRCEPIVTDYGRAIRITASAGMAFLHPTNPQSAQDLLVEADVAMYQAKDTGRDRLALYSNVDPRQADVRGRHTWVERIQDALEHDRFVLHVQPILDLRIGRVNRYETLLRMVADDGSLIMPNEFLPIAERSGLIARIDQWVVTTACRMLGDLQRAGHDIHIEVNLSGPSMGDPAILDVIEREMAFLPRLGGLIIEVTETAAIVDIDRARLFAERLEALGCEFALDDFGAGYGSFYYLKHLPFDYLKIDGTFIKDLLTNRADEVLVRSLVQIATELGKRTVAEFVQDDATLVRLVSLGVDFAQGYHIGRPTGLADSTALATVRSAPAPAPVSGSLVRSIHLAS